MFDAVEPDEALQTLPPGVLLSIKLRDRAVQHRSWFLSLKRF